ncbi:MAG: HD domain-containing protein, partial [Myxococcales bacterium]|nr:HD domain-containing protein [Myxococcales bacterium]
MILRDPVHGLIAFSGPTESVVVRLLDCREVQRLRRIRALGLACLAYPGGEHSRFAHAVGSAHVMQRYLERVRSLADELPAHDRIDPWWEAVALAAALLHDLGHGPFSHTFEAVIPGMPRHEHWTSRILLDPGTEVHQVLASIDPSMPGKVDRLIHGESEIRHLARAVAGTFDVDRCDYLLRDSYMTGVRYGTLDLDWLLMSLRLYVPEGQSEAYLAVDGEKGLTAVESFFLARLYMYRQVYLHKAVRSAEVVLRALVRRLCELGPEPGTPPALARLLRGETLSVGEYLDMDDRTLETAIMAYCESGDPVLADLAGRLRHRRLFKSLRLRPEADSAAVQGRLDGVLAAAGIAPSYLGIVDRVEVDAYRDDAALVVISSSGRRERLIDASPVLRGLSRERFVQHRAIFPPEIRGEVRE